MKTPRKKMRGRVASIVGSFVTRCFRPFDFTDPNGTASNLTVTGADVATTALQQREPPLPVEKHSGAIHHLNATIVQKHYDHPDQQHGCCWQLAAGRSSPAQPSAHLQPSTHAHTHTHANTNTAPTSAASARELTPSSYTSISTSRTTPVDGRARSDCCSADAPTCDTASSRVSPATHMLLATEYAATCVVAIKAAALPAIATQQPCEPTAKQQMPPTPPTPAFAPATPVKQPPTVPSSTARPAPPAPEEPAKSHAGPLRRAFSWNAPGEELPAHHPLASPPAATAAASNAGQSPSRSPLLPPGQWLTPAQLANSAQSTSRFHLAMQQLVRTRELIAQYIAERSETLARRYVGLHSAVRGITLVKRNPGRAVYRGWLLLRTPGSATPTAIEVAMKVIGPVKARTDRVRAWLEAPYGARTDEPLPMEEQAWSELYGNSALVLRTIKYAPQLLRHLVPIRFWDVIPLAGNGGAAAAGDGTGELTSFYVVQVCNWARRGCLTDAILDLGRTARAGRPVPWATAVPYLYQTVGTMDAMESCGAVLSDLKTDNAVLTAGGLLRWIDVDGLRLLPEEALQAARGSSAARRALRVRSLAASIWSKMYAPPEVLLPQLEWAMQQSEEQVSAACPGLVGLVEKLRRSQACGKEQLPERLRQQLGVEGDCKAGYTGSKEPRACLGSHLYAWGSSVLLSLLPLADVMEAGPGQRPAGWVVPSEVDQAVWSELIQLVECSTRVVPGHRMPPRMLLKRLWELNRKWVGADLAGLEEEFGRGGMGAGEGSAARGQLKRAVTMQL